MQTFPGNTEKPLVIDDGRAEIICEVDEKYAVRCYYAASNGNLLPTFRDNLSVQGLKNGGIKCVLEKDGDKLWFSNVIFNSITV
jgi:hypothetical protein